MTESTFDLRGVGFAVGPALGRGRQQAMHLEAQFKKGCHAVVVQDEAQADAFLLTCTGMKRPLWGRVRYNQLDVHSSPGARAQMASLYREELNAEDDLTQLRVEAFFNSALAQLYQANSVRTDAARLPPTLVALAERKLNDLAPLERRLLMCELAFCHPAPRVAVLYEPWSVLQGTASLSPERRWLDELRRLTGLGAIVLVVTKSQEQAVRATAHVLHTAFIGAQKRHWLRRSAL